MKMYVMAAGLPGKFSKWMVIASLVAGLTSCECQRQTDVKPVSTPEEVPLDTLKKDGQENSVKPDSSEKASKDSAR